MALHLVEFDAVQLLEALVTELTGVVVVRLRSVFLHVPVQRGTLATLVAANFAPKRGEKKKETKQKKPKKTPTELRSLGGCINALGLSR